MTIYAIGVEKSVSRMKEEGMSVPANVEQMLASGATSFYKKESGQQFYFDFASGKYVALIEPPGVIILKSVKDQKGVIKKNAGASLIDIGDGVEDVAAEPVGVLILAELVLAHVGRGAPAVRAALRQPRHLLEQFGAGVARSAR